MDGFEEINNVKVLLATNRIEALDSALLRPGRIDRIIEFSPPNSLERIDIFSKICSKMNLSSDVKLNICQRK